VINRHAVHAAFAIASQQLCIVKVIFCTGKLETFTRTYEKACAAVFAERLISGDVSTDGSAAEALVSRFAAIKASHIFYCYDSDVTAAYLFMTFHNRSVQRLSKVSAVLQLVSKKQKPVCLHRTWSDL